MKKLKKIEKLFLHTFQNNAHLLEPKTQFGHSFWGGGRWGQHVVLLFSRKCLVDFILDQIQREQMGGRGCWVMDLF